MSIYLIDFIMLEFPSSSLDSSVYLRGNRSLPHPPPPPHNRRPDLLVFPELLHGRSSSTFASGSLPVEVRPVAPTAVASAGFLPPIDGSAGFERRLEKRRTLKKSSDGESSNQLTNQHRIDRRLGLFNDNSSALCGKIDKSPSKSLLLRPINGAKSKGPEDKFSAANSSFDLGMTQPLFSVRPCPRYEKPVVAAAPATISCRASLETLFPNVRNLLKLEVKKKQKISTSTVSRKSPQKTEATTTPPRTIRWSTGLAKDAFPEKNASTSTQRQIEKSLSIKESNASPSNSSDSQEGKRKRAKSGRKGTKELRPASRKSARGKRKSRKSGDEDVFKGNSKFSGSGGFNQSLKSEKNINTVQRNFIDCAKSDVSGSGGGSGRRVVGGICGDDQKTMVELLSKKLSGLSLYKKSNGETSKHVGDVNHSAKANHGIPKDKRSDDESEKEKAKNKSNFEFTLFGKRGKIEEKSSPPLPRAQPHQPIIMGKFISSCAFPKDEESDGDVDGNNNNVIENSQNSVSLSFKSLKNSFSKESLKAKKEFETATSTTTTAKPKRADNLKDDGKEGGRNVKIYLSNKQTSDVRMEGGVFLPGAPPATPRDSYAKFVDFVPAMSDIRSQRQLRTTLEGMEQKQKVKAERLEMAARDADAERRKEAALKLKVAQRREIYELNRIMEELEHKNFLQFCRNKGIEVDC